MRRFEAVALFQKNVVATAGAGGDFVENDEIQPIDEVQRLTISPASSPWECQANMAPTPTKAVMEKSGAGYSPEHRGRVRKQAD